MAVHTLPALSLSAILISVESIEHLEQFNHVIKVILLCESAVIYLL